MRKWITVAGIGLVLGFVVACWTVILPHRALGVGFGGSGYFISRNACTDITSPVPNQSICWDATNAVLDYWNGVIWVSATGAFPLGQSADFNNYGGINVGNLQLVKLPPPSSLSATSTCTGTCATTYTYAVTCVTDTGESAVSASVTASNSATVPFPAGDQDVLNWALEPACSGGYNIYGRTTLGLLANIDVNTTTYTDTGTATGGASYTFKFNSSAYPAVAVWDLSGASTTQAPIDLFSSNTGNGVTLKATSITTTGNHDTQIPIFAFHKLGSTFTAPGGFSNTVAVGAAPSVNQGLWGGTKDIAAAGATGTATGTIASTGHWATMNIGVLPASVGTPITVAGTASATASTPYKSVNFSDPPGSTVGDLEIVCVAWQKGAGLTAPISFSLIGSASSGAPHVAVNCYWNIAQGTTPPPTVNQTGILTQTTENGAVYKEVLLGIVPWSANNGGFTNGAGGSVINSMTYPVPLTVTSCRKIWANYASCSPFPVWALKDVTANKVICSSGTVSVSDTDTTVTPSFYLLPANDELAFLATTPGVSCSSGVASMSIQMHQ